MTWKDFFKSVEALVVLGGLFLAVTFGTFWAIATAIVYTLLNVPKAWQWIKAKLGIA